jgi:hypothetical protein
VQIGHHRAGYLADDGWQVDVCFVGDLRSVAEAIDATTGSSGVRSDQGPTLLFRSSLLLPLYLTRPSGRVPALQP